MGAAWRDGHRLTLSELHAQGQRHGNGFWRECSGLAGLMQRPHRPDGALVVGAEGRREGLSAAMAASGAQVAAFVQPVVWLNSRFT
jgi:hypothetical protein